MHLTHISTLGPSYSLPSKSSGAAYGGLPQWVRSNAPGRKMLLNPKSTTYLPEILAYITATTEDGLYNWRWSPQLKMVSTTEHSLPNWRWSPQPKMASTTEHGPLVSPTEDGLHNWIHMVSTTGDDLPNWKWSPQLKMVSPTEDGLHNWTWSIGLPNWRWSPQLNMVSTALYYKPILHYQNLISAKLAKAIKNMPLPWLNSTSGMLQPLPRCLFYPYLGLICTYITQLYANEADQIYNPPLPELGTGTTKSKAKAQLRTLCITGIIIIIFSSWCKPIAGDGYK